MPSRKLGDVLVLKVGTPKRGFEESVELLRERLSDIKVEIEDRRAKLRAMRERFIKLEDRQRGIEDAIISMMR